MLGMPTPTPENPNVLEVQREPEAQQHRISTPTTDPYPRWPLYIVFLTQFSEPLTAMVIYPFAPALIRTIGVTHGNDNATGYYAGILESVFFLTEFLTCYAWARLSDRIGRRPVLMIGPLGLSLAMFSFGLSNNFWLLVLSRAFQGIFNGNLGIGKTVISELVAPEYISHAMSALPFAWTSGGTFANIIGGSLSDPATKWPQTLGKIALMGERPYFLPCGIAGAVAFISFMLTYIGLRETLPSMTVPTKQSEETRELLDQPDVQEYGALLFSNASSAPSVSHKVLPAPAPAFRDLFTRQFGLTLLAHAHMTFLDMTFIALIPLMYSTSIQDGGLSFTPRTIGIVIASRGIASTLIQLGFSARLLNRYGPRNILLLCFATMFPTIIAFPILNIMAKENKEMSPAIWGLLSIQLCLSAFQSLSYSSIYVLLVDSAETKSALASTNSIAQMIGCGTRVIAPAVSASLFSLSLERKLLGGNLVYFLWIFLVVSALHASRKLPSRLQRI